MAASNFPFTTGADNFTDNAGDTLTASATTATFSTNDVIDAGDMIDTLQLTGGGSFSWASIGGLSLTNFENIVLLTNNAVTMDFNDNAVAAGQTMSVDATALTSAAYSFDGAGEANGKVSLVSGGGDDTITGTTGDDTLSGANGADRLTGGAGADIIDGGIGDDTIVGDNATATGADTLSGGAGSDVFIYFTAAQFAGGENIDGGTGTADDIRFATSTGGTTLTLTAAVTNIEIARISDDAGNSAGNLALNLDASALANAITLIGNNGANLLIGTAQADTISANAGSDTVSGGAGDDLLSGGDDADLLIGGTGNDTFRGTAAELNGDTITGAQAGDQILVVGTDLTALSGTTVSTTLSLGGGNTLNITGAAASFVYSTSIAGGNTTLTFSPPPPPVTSDSGSSTTVTDGVTVTSTSSTSSSGVPTTSYVIPAATTSRVDQTGTTSTTTADVAIATNAQGTVIEVGLGAGTGASIDGPVSGRSTAGATTDLVAAIQARSGVTASDQSSMSTEGQTFLSTLPAGTSIFVRTIVPSTTDLNTSGLLVVRGMESPASMSGVSEAVVIDARNLPSGSTIQLQNVDFAAVLGNATVTGGDGAQNVMGDSSNQVLLLGSGDDTLRGGGGDDFVGSTTGNDSLFGNSGNDTVQGGVGNDIVYGNQNNDIVYGNQGNDRIFGGQDADTLYGGQDSDTISGGIGSDVVYGNLASDVLYGEADVDTLYGGGGDDTLFGSDGNADVLVGGLGADQFQLAAGQSATIADWSSSDSIVVTGMGAAGRVSMSAASDATTLAIDADGDGVAESSITLTGQFGGTFSASVSNGTATVVYTSNSSTTTTTTSTGGGVGDAGGGGSGFRPLTDGPAIDGWMLP